MFLKYAEGHRTAYADDPNAARTRRGCNGGNSFIAAAYWLVMIGWTRQFNGNFGLFRPVMVH